ncbi:unnamed protein product [Schistosoma mattheei]|uniref:Rab-GAP TBC domain-containing protein n=1 Tax=Schistosoma mattheei TaxID=31246 RepID=A0AA85AYL6_9TREM|nr:unnamed protein product [Schistosoma mattheei]
MRPSELHINVDRKLNGAGNIDCRKWEDVYLMYISNQCPADSISIKGTLFLTDHGSKVSIHWVPHHDQDSSLSQEDRKGYEIDIKDMDFLVIRKAPCFPCRGVYLSLKSQKPYGPFEFRKGGSSSFLRSLSTLADVRRCHDDENRYIVRPRPQYNFTSNYHLPDPSARVEAEGLIGSPFSGQLGASLRNIGIHVNSIVSTILSPNLIDENIAPNNGSSEEYFAKCIAEDLQKIEAARLRTTDDEGGFAVVERRPNPIFLPPMPTVQRSLPLNMTQWKKSLDPEGRVNRPENLREIIFNGGIENDLKPIVWKYLLGYYQWTYTAEENERLKVEKSREYHILKTFWKSMSSDREARFALFRDRKCFIDKDVPRTDRKTDFYSDDSHGNLTRLSDILITYTIYNMDFGYFQGMNDLLALILYVIKDEEDSFWCFVGLMNRLESNFNGELNAVREQFNQLFSLIEIVDPTFSEYLESKSAKEMPFCFRWLLIHFKREFSYKDTMTLWEAFWTDYRTKNFHIFFAAAILLTQRDNIMNRKYDANSILKHVNELSMKIPLEDSIIRATALLGQLEQVSDSLPHSVQDIIHGQSLATSRHVNVYKEENTSCTEHSSSIYDYSPTLLNEQLEVLMDNEMFDPNKDITNQSILMIPSNSSRQFF